MRKASERPPRPGMLCCAPSVPQADTDPTCQFGEKFQALDAQGGRDSKEQTIKQEDPNLDVYAQASPNIFF